MIEIYSVELRDFKAEIAEGYVIAGPAVPLSVSVEKTVIKFSERGTIKVYACIIEGAEKVYNAEAVFCFRCRCDVLPKGEEEFETAVQEKILKPFINMNTCILIENEECSKTDSYRYCS